MLCDGIDMNDTDAQEILKYDEELKNLKIYNSNQTTLNDRQIQIICERIRKRIQGSYEFEEKFLKKILKAKDKEKYEKIKGTAEYYYNYYCFFLALKNLYYKLKSLDNNNNNSWIKELEYFFPQLSATILEKFKDLYIESRKKIIIKKGKVNSFIPLDQISLKDYNQTIRSYNDFLTVYKNALVFLKQNCENRCEFYNKIRTNINNLKAECYRFNSQIVSFMNQQEVSFKNEFVKVNPDPENKNNRRKNNSSSAATEQTGLLTQNRNKQNNPSSAATEQTGLLTKNEQKSKKNNRNNPSSVATEQTGLLPKNKQKSGCSIL